MTLTLAWRTYFVLWNACCATNEQGIFWELSRFGTGANDYSQGNTGWPFYKDASAGADSSKREKIVQIVEWKLFNYWDKFNEHHLTTETLLEKVAEMYTDFNAIKYAKNVNDSRSVELEH
jgi:hypothetical protein